MILAQSSVGVGRLQHVFFVCAVEITMIFIDALVHAYETRFTVRQDRFYGHFMEVWYWQ